MKSSSAIAAARCAGGSIGWQKRYYVSLNKFVQNQHKGFTYNQIWRYLKNELQKKIRSPLLSEVKLSPVSKIIRNSVPGYIVSVAFNVFNNDDIILLEYDVCWPS